MTWHRIMQGSIDGHLHEFRYLESQILSHDYF
jgi:hypothetical protein